MAQLLLYPYDPASESARLLAAALGIRRIRHRGSNYQPRRGDTIINWGASRDVPHYMQVGELERTNYSVLNKPHNVANAKHKIRCFDLIKEYNQQHPAVAINIPEYWTRADEAVAWFAERPSRIVLARRTVTGSGGEGIEVCTTRDQITAQARAPMFVGYIPKMYEFRVHVVGDDIIDVTRKIRNPAAEPTSWLIRSHDNGFIFQHDVSAIPVDVMNQVKTQAYNAVRALSLDFGGVDVIYNQARERAYVLEINTAPGIEGITVGKYADALR